MTVAGTAYLNSLLTRYNTNPVFFLPLTPAYQRIAPLLRQWAGGLLIDLKVSGSNAKGTAVAGEADLDLFISLHSNLFNTHTLAQAYNHLASTMRGHGYAVRSQNVSIRINHGGTEVDIVPGVRFTGGSNNHWLYVTRSGRDRTMTNIDTHIARVSRSGRIPEIRLSKIWRKVNNLEFPSIYLEEIVMDALSGYRLGNTEDNFWRVLQYLRDSFMGRRIVDPANTANIISNDLTVSEKQAIVRAATNSRAQGYWRDIVW